jgi:hypothetical protein
VAERALASTDDPAADADPVRVGDRRRMVERPLQRRGLAVEVRVERQLLGDDERRDEHDARATIRREPACEVEGMLGLFSAEQRHDDAAVTDRRRAACEATNSMHVGATNHRTWYGTLARITPGSKRSSRLT